MIINFVTEKLTFFPGKDGENRLVSFNLIIADLLFAYSLFFRNGMVWVIR